MQYQDQSISFFVSELNTRIRALESRHTLLSEKLLLVNENMIDEYKKLMKEIKAVDQDIKELQGEVSKLKEITHHLVKEIDNFARKEEVKVLEKYINMWNPLKFVTEEDVIKIVESYVKLKKRGAKKDV